MQLYAESEASAHLAEILDRVGRGELVGITREGRVVAQVVPMPLPDSDANRAREAAARLRSLRTELAANGVRITQEEIRQMRDEGRR